LLKLVTMALPHKECKSAGKSLMSHGTSERVHFHSKKKQHLVLILKIRRVNIRVLAGKIKQPRITKILY